MLNNKGYGKYEVLTIIVLLMGLFCYGSFKIVKRVELQKFDTMKDSAINFSKVTATNIASFHNTETVYLDEVIDENLISKIKSPFSSNYCDGSESKVEMIDGVPYVTLKCDDYLIERAKFSDKSGVNIYKVTPWSRNKSGDDLENKVLYNCSVNGKDLYSNYYEELYFVSLVNKENHTDYYFSNEVNSTCNVVSYNFYRNKIVHVVD